MTTLPPATIGRTLLNKVPEVTLLFWIVKIMSTTVGETVADFFSTTLSLGLNGTTVVMLALLIVALIVQFRQHRYVPAAYWVTVVFISVFGTLVTDNLTDNLGIELWMTTVIFAIALAVVFIAWFATERTLSIHSITTFRREAFYWLAILLTFALGTAGGDLFSEGLDLGYLLSGIIFASVIAVIAGAHFFFKLNAVLAFWAAYVLTRPFGAAFGDLLSQPTDAGGLGLGTTITSAVFLVIIVVIVTVLARREKKEQPTLE
ncbi:membrane protein [Alpinimonas psychrophila]|uniref:Putative membrane-anchored protein n=1 Tax=Alpinimonas psychrophila TaxID=748908 RepID=A0A7W3JRW2_9MICO|nr:hypothetical protein [Alpinimonas psychrophila]MBA8828104.1 putative membrane-anchored protein [Alpinimonas psychrophila]